MKQWIGAAVMALGLALSGPAATGSAAAANSKIGLHEAGLHTTDASKATDPGARRSVRHYRHDAYRAYDRPRYYDRPYDYRPYPYAAPVPFFLGFGFGPLRGNGGSLAKVQILSPAARAFTARSRR